MSNKCPKCGKEVEWFPNGSYFCIDDDCKYYGDSRDDMIYELRTKLAKAEAVIEAVRKLHDRSIISMSHGVEYREWNGFANAFHEAIEECDEENNS